MRRRGRPAEIEVSTYGDLFVLTDGEEEGVETHRLREVSPGVWREVGHDGNIINEEKT